MGEALSLASPAVLTFPNACRLYTLRGIMGLFVNILYIMLAHTYYRVDSKPSSYNLFILLMGVVLHQVHWQQVWQAATWGVGTPPRHIWESSIWA